MRNRIVIVLLLAVLTIGFYWKLTLTREEYVWFDHPDMTGLEIPRLEFQAREFHRGRFPLWDPHIWMGQPLIGQTQPGPIYPLNIAMMLVPLDENGYIRFRTLNWYFVVIHFIAALGGYLLARSLERSRTASVLAGAAYSFAGFCGSVAWLDVLNGAIWIPFVGCFFVRAVREKNLGHAAASGLFAGVACLSGHHEVPRLTSLALLVAWITARQWVSGFVSLAVCGLVGAAQVLPMVEFGRLAKRWGPAGGPVGWEDRIAYLSSSIYSLTPRSLAGVLLPGHGTNADSTAFLGIVTVALAVIGIGAMWREWRAVRWLAWAGLAATVYALGEFTPVHGWIQSMLPLLSKARMPSRAIALIDFAVVMLAAFGVDRLLQAEPGDVVEKRTGYAALALGVLILVASVIFRVETNEETVLSGFVAIVLFFVLRFRDRVRPVVVAGALLLLMVVEWHATFAKPWQSRYDESAQRYARSLEKHRDIVQYLHGQPGPVRVRVNDQDVLSNFGDLHSIDMQEGYVAAATANLLHFPRHTAVSQRIYAITHYLAKKPDLPTLEPGYRGQQDDVQVFRVTDSLPRARAVHRVEVAPTAWHLGGLLENPGFDPAVTALLVGGPAPALEECTGDEVRVAAYAPNRVRIGARMQCRGLVILADTWFPGWEATVDGRRVPILEVYGALRGVVVDAGSHEIDFRYRPTSVYAGGALFGLGLFAVPVAYWRSRKSRRQGIYTDGRS